MTEPEALEPENNARQYANSHFEKIVCVQLELDHMMSLHLRSRMFPSKAALTETVRVLAALSDRIVGRKSPPPVRPRVRIFIIF
jgi:hypothetical protein